MSFLDSSQFCGAFGLIDTVNSSFEIVFNLVVGCGSEIDGLIGDFGLAAVVLLFGGNIGVVELNPVCSLALSVRSRCFLHCAFATFIQIAVDRPHLYLFCLLSSPVVATSAYERLSLWS